MSEPEHVTATLRQIMREMAATIAKAGGDPGGIELWDQPPQPAPPHKPRLRLLKGGKDGSAQPHG